MDGRLDELVVGPGRTDVQRLVLGHDWSGTPLGAEEHWSPLLRTTVGTMLNSRFGMLLMWGPELVMVYNDGYAPMLGGRHPAALGGRVPEVWPDIWPDISGMVARVFAGGVVAMDDLPLVMTRHGHPEEAYFTFCYSPVMGPGGQVAALLTTIVETTPRVLAARRLAVLHHLGGMPRSGHGSEAQACASLLRVLAEARTDCPFALVYLAEEGVVDAGGAATVRLVASQGIGHADALSASTLPDLVDDVVRTGVARTATGLAETVPGLSLAGASPAGDADVDDAVVLPLVLAGHARPVGAVVLGASPHLRLDEEYRTFLGLVAGQVAATVADARAVERERRLARDRAAAESERARFFADVAVTLQRSFLGPTALPAGFAVHYAPATGTLEVGGDWYDVVDLPGGLYGVVVGDVVGRGLDAAAVMGQLRSAARALLLESRSPHQVLSALDRFAALVPGAVCSTVFVAVVDPQTGSLRYSSAGHLPALLTDGYAVQHLDRAQGLPLAVAPDRERPEATLTTPGGSALLLYTDGLVERRGEDLDAGIARAVTELAGGRGLPADELARLLTQRLLVDDLDDDVAFLVYRVGDRPPGVGPRGDRPRP